MFGLNLQEIMMGKIKTFRSERLEFLLVKTGIRI